MLRNGVATLNHYVTKDSKIQLHKHAIRHAKSCIQYLTLNVGSKVNKLSLPVTTLRVNLEIPVLDDPSAYTDVRMTFIGLQKMYSQKLCSCYKIKFC